jgi:hypothetical protein
MAYTQHFGLSRNSPLNMGGDNTSKEIETKIDTSPEKASSIIDQNNNKSQVANAALNSGKFFTKQLIKEGLKKYVGPMVSKVFGVGSMMLSPTTAYGGQKSKKELTKGFLDTPNDGGELPFKTN